MEKVRVLIVDDHQEVLEALGRLLDLEESSEVIGFATGGTEAIESARRLHPDLVLMDFSMRDMDGIEAAAAIKADSPATDVVILSVYEEREHGDRARRAGVERWIPKSLAPEMLLSELRGISQQRLRRTKDHDS